MAVSTLKNGTATSSIVRKLPLKAGQSVTYSAVIGVAPPGQMRRAFLAYLERERPRPYQPFLHYNSWYDLGYFNRYTEAECLERIDTFGKELTQKRGVKLSSFLFDDGWDDPNTVWEFTKAFSNGFVPMKQAAAKYGAAPGAWLSPWGGYGTPRKERLAAGAKQGYEIDSQGYALSGPKYYDRFHQVTMDMVTRQGINQFKFDGTGSPDKQFPGSKFDSDFDAAIQLIKDLRLARPGLFINLTTGTWPSPFWTRYADSIWRGGSDHSFAGVGPDRERWITYRDGDTYHGIVLKGPLYPLNSLMLHGLIYAQHAHNLDKDPTGAFRHEVRSYFGSGTQLQEMYITPSLLSKQNWDDIADCAKWSQANADVLKDTHWVGGDPLKGEVYGWAAWSSRKAILTLRNPSDKPQAYALNLLSDLELPSGKMGTLWNVRPALSGAPTLIGVCRAAARMVVRLPAFAVMNLELTEQPNQQPLDFTSMVRPVGVRHSPSIHTVSYLAIGRGAPHADMNAYTINSLGDRIREDISSSDAILITIGALEQGDRPAVQVNKWVAMLQGVQRLAPRTELIFAMAPPSTDEESYDHSILRQVLRESGRRVLDINANTNEELSGAVDNLLNAGNVDKKLWRLVSADSEQPDEGPAKNAIDGDPNTYWHTRYDPRLDRYPHEFVVDMGESIPVAGFRYLPRQDGGVNGRVKRYQLFLSNSTPLEGGRGVNSSSSPGQNGTPWTLVAEGDLPNQLEATRVKLKTPTTARYFKFVALSEQNGESYASAAEIDIIRAK